MFDVFMLYVSLVTGYSTSCVCCVNLLSENRFLSRETLLTTMSSIFFVVSIHKIYLPQRKVSKFLYSFEKYSKVYHFQLELENRNARKTSDDQIKELMELVRDPSS